MDYGGWTGGLNLMSLRDSVDVITAKIQPDTLRILSIDHRVPLIEMAQELGVSQERIVTFKLLVVEAAAQVANDSTDFGMFLDAGHGRQALISAATKNLWLARPIDKPHARPLDFEGDGSLETELSGWPLAHTVKCALYAHPDESHSFWDQTERALLRLSHACRVHGLELLLETLASSHGVIAEDTTARVMQRIYRLGIKPAWWVVEAQPTVAAWQLVGDTVREHDADCRGILTIARSVDGFEDVAKSAKTESMIKGFCAGRSVFGEIISSWMRDEMSDLQAVEAMASRFETVVSAWDNAPYTAQPKVPSA
jgi:5-dehydro-2-deoxygluconokinase